MFYNERHICIKKLFKAEFIFKNLLICTTFLLSVLFLSRNFVVANATQTGEMSIQEENIKISNINTPIKIFGITHENILKISNCFIDKLLFENMYIFTPNGDAFQINNKSNVVINTYGECEVGGKRALVVSDSKVHFGDNSKIKFVGELFFDRGASLSFSPSSEVIFISKGNKINPSSRNINCGSGKAGFFVGKILKRDEIFSDIDVTIVSKDKRTQRKFTLGRDEASFALSLPKNKYTVSYDIKENNSAKFAFEDQTIDVNSSVCRKTLEKIEVKPLEIVGLAVNNPSEYGLCNGKIEFSAIGGSGKYKYFCNNRVSEKGLFTDLASGNYTIGVVDNNNIKVSKTVKLEQPLSTKLDYVLLGETKLKKNSSGNFEITVDENTQTIEFEPQISDDRASVVLNEGKKIVFKKYGIIKIPIEVRAGDMVEMYGISIRRTPPKPKVSDVPKDWMKGDFFFSILPNADNLESYVSLNGGRYSKTSSLKISKSGVNKISAYYEADEVKSAEINHYIKIDNEKPKINDVIIEKLYTKAKETQILSKETTPQFVCKINASDAYSGISSVKAELENGKTEQAYLSDGMYIIPLGEEYKGKILIRAVDKCGNESETYLSEVANCDSQSPKIINTIFPTQTNSDKLIEIVFDEDISENLGKLYYNVNKGASILINSEEAKIQKNKVLINIHLQGGKYKLFIPKGSILDIAGNCMADDEYYCFLVKNSKKSANKTKSRKSNTTSNSVSSIEAIKESGIKNNISNNENLQPENEISQDKVVSKAADELLEKESFSDGIDVDKDISRKINEENILKNFKKISCLVPKTQSLITIINFPSMMLPLYSGVSVINYFSEIS